VSAEPVKPFYAIKVASVSPSQGIVDTPPEISPQLRTRKISGTGTAYNADSTITLTVSQVVDYKWTPKEYYPLRVLDNVGSSLGSAHDTKDLDGIYYKVTADNTSEDQWSADFTFTIEFPSSEIDDAEDIYVMISGISPVSAKIRMYDGNTWKTIRTADLDEDELIEFPVGKEYIQSGEIKVRIYTVDDSKYDVKIDYLALKFRPSKMLAKYTLPEGSKLVSVRKCCSSSIDVTHEVSGPTVAVELSEYMDFENMYYSIEYTYTYTITISDYYVTQKTIISLSPYETPQTELEYSESMRISMPYSHKITIEAEPSISATSLTQLRVSDKERTVNNEKGSTQKFEMEGSGTINLVYRLRNAYSFKSEHLYNQTSANPMNPSWSSRYSLRRGYDVELSNVSIRHELVGDRNRTTVDVKPVTDWYPAQSGQIMYIQFPSLKNDVIVTVQEATAGLSVNYTHPIQVTNPISIGSSPVFW